MYEGCTGTLLVRTSGDYFLRAPCWVSTPGTVPWLRGLADDETWTLKRLLQKYPRRNGGLEKCRVLGLMDWFEERCGHSWFTRSQMG